jgi:hypothetical protein
MATSREDELEALKEKSRLELEKTQENIEKKTMLAFIATLIYSAGLWALIVLKAVAEAALKKIFFPIFATFGGLNTSLAVYKAYVSPDQKIIKWTDAISGVFQTLLIGFGVAAPFIGGVIGAVLVAIQPWLFVAAISLWIAHDVARVIYHSIAYFRLWRAGLAGTPEAQEHKATANASIKSALVGVATLIAMVSMLGLVLALMSNPITGPVVLAFSAAFAVYLAVQYITTYTERGREWAKIWNKKYPRIVKAWHFICHPLSSLCNPLGKFIGQQWAAYKGKKEPIAEGSHSQTIPATAAPQSNTVTLEPMARAQALSPEQTSTLKRISPFFKHRYAEDVQREANLGVAYNLLIGVINGKISALEGKIQKESAAAKSRGGRCRRMISRCFWRSERQQDKLDFLSALKGYIDFFYNNNLESSQASDQASDQNQAPNYGKYQDLGFSEEGFELFMKKQADAHPGFARADFGISEVKTIAEAAKILLAKIKGGNPAPVSEEGEGGDFTPRLGE